MKYYTCLVTNYNAVHMQKLNSISIIQLASYNLFSSREVHQRLNLQLIVTRLPMWTQIKKLASKLSKRVPNS